MNQYLPVLLTHSYYPEPEVMGGIFGQASHPPLGIAYLSSYLKQKQVEVNCLDLNKDKESSVFDWLERNQIGLVGMSVNAATFPYAYELAKKIRRLHPYHKIVFGGLAVPLYFECLFQGVVDFFVIGDGEETTFELLKEISTGSLNFSEIAGMAYVKDGQLVVTPSRIFSNSLDDLPFPDREAFDLKSYVPLFPDKPTLLLPGVVRILVLFV